MPITEKFANGNELKVKTKRVYTRKVQPESNKSESDTKPARHKRPYTSASAAVYHELNAKVEGAKSAANNAQLELLDLKEKLDRDIAALTDIYNAEVLGRNEYIADLNKLIAMGEAAFEAHNRLEMNVKSNSDVEMAS